MPSLKVLQIGAGSMGKRRLRDLTGRAGVELGLWDPREDRRQTAAARFCPTLFASLEAAIAWAPHAAIISTPPDRHQAYIELALEHGWHHFSEANVWTHDHVRVEQLSAARGLVSAVSNSLWFLPVVKELRRIVAEEVGTLHAYQAALSTWMPGWHPEEGPEFYARNRATSAGREMVPFELLWLNEVFGTPAEACGTVSQRGTLAAASEDTWSLSMRLQSGAHAQLTVLMACPTPYRRGQAWGEAGQVLFDVPAGRLERNLPDRGLVDTREFGSFAEVLETAYREEIHTFLDAVEGRTQWPHSYAASSTATATLAAAERSAASGRWEPVDRARQPEPLPCGCAEVRT
jgi:predicted dehydrogenase